MPSTGAAGGLPTYYTGPAWSNLANMTKVCVGPMSIELFPVVSPLN